MAKHKKSHQRKKRSGLNHQTWSGPFRTKSKPSRRLVVEQIPESEVQELEEAQGPEVENLPSTDGVD